jgi:hypothetical protein
MEPIEEELNEMRKDIEMLGEANEEVKISLREIHDAIVGTRLVRNSGLIFRLEMVERNITTISTSLNRLEKQFEDQIKSIILDKTKSTVKLNILWYLLGTVTSGMVLFIISKLTTK